MSLIWATGFDHEPANGGSAIDDFKSEASTTGMIQSTTARTGKAVKWTTNVESFVMWQTSSGYPAIPGTPAAVNYLHCALRIHTAPTNPAEPNIFAATGAFRVCGFGSDLKPFIRDSAATYVRSTNAFALDTWYWVGLHLDNSATRVDKLWVRKLDGIDAGSYWINSTNGLIQEAQNPKWFVLGPAAAKGAAIGEYYQDNVIWLTPAGTVNNALLTDEHECFVAVPTGNSGSTGYQVMKRSDTNVTPGDYTMWNENPVSGATNNYSDANSVRKEQASVIASAATLGITAAPIGFVGRWVYDAGALGFVGTHNFVIWDGVTESLVAGDTNWTGVQESSVPCVFEKDPSGAAWTVAAIANFQMGVDAISVSNPTNTKRVFYTIWGTFVCPKAVVGARRVILC